MYPERIQARIAEAARAFAAYTSLGAEAAESEQAEAAGAYVAAGVAMLREIAREPAAGETAPPPEERREALRMLLDVEQPLRAGLPDAMAGLVRFAAGDPDDVAEGVTREEWQNARDMLTGNGFLEPGELATFPVESLVAIALDRFNQREQS